MSADRDELLAAVDLEALTTELVGPKVRGGWSCPNKNHAQTGATPPMKVNPTTGRWKCWGCGEGGSAVDLVMVALGVDVAEAFEWLRGRTGRRRRPPRRPATSSPSRLYSEAGEPVLNDLCAKRGWDRAITDRFGLHAVRDRWGRVRVRFPYRDAGVARWHQDRAVGAAEPKWLAPAGQRPILFAPDLARTLEHVHHTGHAVVLEGPADLVSLAHAFNLFGVVALPGSAIGVRSWARMLVGIQVTLLVDADEAGERLRAAADEVFAPGTLHHVRLPSSQIEDVDQLRRLVGCDDHAFAQAIAELFGTTFAALTPVGSA